MKTDVLTGKLEFSSLKPCDLNNVSKEEIKDYFNNTFEVYESLFYAINDDSYFYLCPDRLRLPLIFYYGHTAVVYMNKMVLGGLAKPSERINLEFETTFETGVDEMSWDDTEHYRMGGDYKWPSVEETKEFRHKLRKLINEVIDRTPLVLPVKWDSPWWALFMGFEHERIHLETSSVLIRQLPVHMVSKPPSWQYGPLKLAEKVVSNEMINIPKTKVHLGKDFDYPSYGWDNEYGRVDCEVTEFEASKYKITNEEFLEFIKAKGYETKSYWSDEGWNWLQFRKLKHPSFWVCPDNCKSGCGSKIGSYSHCQPSFFNKEKKLSEDSNVENYSRPEFPYKLRLMFNIVDMPFNWPVEIVYHEAKAFCKWKGENYRLLSEAEHHAIRNEEEFSLDVLNDIIYQDQSVNHNLVYGSSTPVDFYPSNKKGFNDVFGNTWEWCEDHFNGLPGFKTSYMYDDFSTPCFDGRHNIIMGGSWISTGDEASRYARFMFRRHFLQHCGFRMARSILSGNLKADPQIRLISNQIYIAGGGFLDNEVTLDESKVIMKYYPTENKQYFYDSDFILLKKQLELEYESKWFDSFISNLQAVIKNRKNGNKMRRAIHLGASTGRVSFELAKLFDQVIAVDFCGLFIDTCLKIQKNEAFELETSSKRIRKTFEKNESYFKKVCFKQMTWIPNEIPKSEFVLFSMIDRVMNPLSWMKKFKEIVDTHGILIICSENSTWDCQSIEKIIGTDFNMVDRKEIAETSLLMTSWKWHKS